MTGITMTVELFLQLHRWEQAATGGAFPDATSASTTSAALPCTNKSSEQVMPTAALFRDDAALSAATASTPGTDASSALHQLLAWTAERLSSMLVATRKENVLAREALHAAYDELKTNKQLCAPPTSLPSAH